MDKLIGYTIPAARAVLDGVAGDKINQGMQLHNQDEVLCYQNNRTKWYAIR